MRSGASTLVLKIGELVEFFPEDEMGRWKALKVCAPGGGDVEGAPHPSARRARYRDDYEYTMRWRSRECTHIHLEL